MSRQEGLISYFQLDFEEGDGHYDKKEEKKERKAGVALFVVVLIGISFCLAVTTYLFIVEMDYRINGTKQTVYCSAPKSAVSFVAPDGDTYYVRIEWSFIRKDTKTVDVYYMGTDYNQAIVMTDYKMWLACYVVFCGLFMLILYCIIRKLKPKKHTQVYEEDERKKKKQKHGESIYTRKELKKNDNIYARK